MDKEILQKSKFSGNGYICTDNPVKSGEGTFPTYTFREYTDKVNNTAHEIIQKKSNFEEYMVTVITVACVTCAVGATIGWFLLQYRLKLAYWILRTFSKNNAKFSVEGLKRLRKKRRKNGPNTRHEYDFDVFISYSKEERDWLEHELLPNLEGKMYEDTKFTEVLNIDYFRSRH